MQEQERGQGEPDLLRGEVVKGARWEAAATSNVIISDRWSGLKKKLCMYCIIYILFQPFVYISAPKIFFLTYNQDT